MRAMRRRMQMVFQDPYAALNPRKTVVDLVGEGLVTHHMVKSQNEKKEKVVELLKLVGLSEGSLYRYPHEFSGGQRQRINIARAISLRPDFLVCDEAVSALDVSIQAQILNLLIELRSQLNMAYLFIGHDLAVVKSISDRIAVMYLGQIMEFAPTASLFSSARHPYTQALFSAIPIPDPQTKRQRIILPGDVPTPVNPPLACRFHPRCPQAKDICKHKEPPWREQDRHGWKCHFGD
jgi:oligopeptide/dipeptide ABC transporter ATP-binding protein